MDWVHVVAASAWTGGLVGLGFVVAGARRTWSASVVGTVARRFSGMAGACLLVVVASGVYRAWVEVPAVSALWMTAYGRWLVVKLALVVAIVGLGAVNRYSVVPHLTVDQVRARLFSLIAREAALAVLVFGCTAALTESAPARHAQHLRHSAGTESEHRHVTDTPSMPRP